MRKRLIIRRKIGLAINQSDPTFSASDIVGHTLIAMTPVTSYDEPYSDANKINTYAPGQSVGVVTSWIDENAAAGTPYLYWQFMDANGNPYYVPHMEGEFSIQGLVDQGVTTAGQQAQAAIDANKSTLLLEFEKYFPWIIGGVIGIFVLGTYLKDKK